MLLSLESGARVTAVLNWHWIPYLGERLEKPVDTRIG